MVKNCLYRKKKMEPLKEVLPSPAGDQLGTETMETDEQTKKKKDTKITPFS